VPISPTGTASSNSNARTTVNKSAFILQIPSHSSAYFGILGRETYSTRENRYPIHACGPPRNDSMLPHTPGMALAASLDDSQRSGLSQSRSISNFDQDTEYTYLNSRASFPHNDSDRLIGRIGISTVCPLRTLRSTNHSIMFNLQQQKCAHNMLSQIFPFLSTNGVPSGTTSSFTATFIVPATGVCIRNVSRTTESRYDRELSSSMVGLSE